MDERPPLDAAKEHPADLADELQRMPRHTAAQILQSIPDERATAVLAEMDDKVAAEILSLLKPEESQDLVNELQSSEAADIVAEMPPEQREEVLAGLEPAESAKVSELLRYPEDSAGGIMEDRFIALPVDATIATCRQILQDRGEEAVQGASYLYVVDAGQKLIGVISMRDLVFRKPERMIREIMSAQVTAVRVDDDQEKVAQLFAQYHYMALPVLERDGRLVGVVDADRAIEVIQQENTEDMQLMVGLSGEEHSYTTWQKAIGRRLPWLYINLATAFLAAAVVSLFESTIARWTALAVFFPVVAGQAGNAGMQTLTVIIRGMALGEISGKAGRGALIKEIVLGLLNGLAIGIVVGLIGYWWKGSAVFGVIVCLAMFLNMLAAALSGVLVPYGLKAMKIDPALASSILVTTVTDVAGFFFFLGLAATALRMIPAI